MAPSKSTSKAATSSLTNQTLNPTELQEELLAAQAETLRAQLADRSSGASSPDAPRLATHLAGEAYMPTDDLVPDLFDKLTLDLQQAVLPMYPNI